MDDLDLERGSISSEDSSQSAVCPKQRQLYHQQLWSEEDVIRAISNLPAGKTALSVIPTLSGERLEKVIKDVKEADFSETKVKDQISLIPRFANG